MGMTKEQLIREMIQVELLYRTKQQLKKNKLNESAYSHNQGPQAGIQQSTAPSTSATPQTSSNITMNLNKTTNYKIGDKCNNDFIKSLKDATVTLDTLYQINENNNPRNAAITELKYTNLLENDINKIWNGFFKEVLTEYFVLPGKGADKAIKALKDADEDTTLNSSGKVFGIFEDYFPIGSLPYTSKNDMAAIVKHLEDNKDKDLYQAIYLNNEKEGTFSTGKGEFLCVLLTKNATSGGSTELDVAIKGGNFYDVKQITPQNPDINFSFSSKSGVRKPKNQFIDIYRKLGERIYSLKDELKLLNVDDDLIQTIDNFEGYMGANFSNESSYEKLYKSGTNFINAQGQTTASQQQKYTASNIPKTIKASKTAIPPSYIAFKDVIMALTQALVGLKSKTYNDMINFNSLINRNLSNVYRDPQFDKKTILNNNIKINYTAQTESAKITYTPLLNQSSNIEQGVIDFLSKNYLLKLINFNQLQPNELNNLKSNNGNLISFNDAKISYADKSTPPTQINKVIFKYLDINIYNNKINDIFKKNKASNYAKYFELDINKPVIDNFITAGNIVAGDFIHIKALFNQIFNTNNIFDELIKKDATNDMKGSDLKNRWTSILSVIKNVYNSQVVLSEKQAEKISKIIASNLASTSQLQNAPNTSQRINDDFVVVEPLSPKISDGEFVIDISFYKNKKKRHIDTLHSQDFKITNSTGNKLTKVSKETGIKTVQDTIKKVEVELNDVISDKQQIDAKLKQYNFFNSLQPQILEKLFLNQSPKALNKIIPSNIKKITQNTPSLPQSNISYMDANQMIVDPNDAFMNIQIQDPNNPNDPSATVSKTVRNPNFNYALKIQNSGSNIIFMNKLKSLRAKIKEDNFLTELYDLYFATDALEKAIRAYYANQNSVITFKDDGSKAAKYTNVYNWSVDTFGPNYDENIGFLTGINAIGMQCNGDITVSDPSVKTIKENIQVAFQEILNLMLSVQSITRK